MSADHIEPSADVASCHTVGRIEDGWAGGGYTERNASLA